MREAPGAAVLVALPGLAQRLAPRRTRAVAPAVALAAVAAAANQHLGSAACAGECPGAALCVALPSSTHPAARNEASARGGDCGLASMHDKMRRVPYCARTRGQHEWGAVAQTTCRSSRPPRPFLSAQVLPRLDGIALATAPSCHAHQRRPRPRTRGLGWNPSTSSRRSNQPAAAICARQHHRPRDPTSRALTPVPRAIKTFLCRRAATAPDTVPSRCSVGHFQ